MENVELNKDEKMEGEAQNAAPRPFKFGEVVLRPYQCPIFNDHKSGIVVLHWARQVGKSFVLAAWAVLRLLDNPGRLVTVLSNSRENGAEFLLKCSEICRSVDAPFETDPPAGNLDFDGMRMELRIRTLGKTGRIKVLAANPRTARGFSGDLILDEFAFHEDSAAIWAAAEPILASNPNYLCRIASTGNGRHNMFFRMVESGWLMEDGQDACTKAPPSTIFKLSRITRTRAHQLGVPIHDLQTREAITPEQARAQALDKRAYDQNFECAFGDESLALLTHELIAAAERDGIGVICEGNWSSEAMALLNSCGRLYAGFDVGRKKDLSVITVIEPAGSELRVRAILRMQDMRLPEQELRLGELCRLRLFQRVTIDLTGLGLGLFEYAQKSFGNSRIRGINFASTVPLTKTIVPEGAKRETVRVTEAMAMELLRVYEDRRIRHPRDEQLREDLRKVEKITSPSGKVSIAATRDEAGHADHFWSLALALESYAKGPVPFAYQGIPMPSVRRYSWEDREFLI